MIPFAPRQQQQHSEGFPLSRGEAIPYCNVSLATNLPDRLNGLIKSHCPRSLLSTAISLIFIAIIHNESCRASVLARGGGHTTRKTEDNAFLFFFLFGAHLVHTLVLPRITFAFHSVDNFTFFSEFQCSKQTYFFFNVVCVSLQI